MLLGSVGARSLENVHAELTGHRPHAPRTYRKAGVDNCPALATGATIRNGLALPLHALLPRRTARVAVAAAVDATAVGEITDLAKRTL